MSAVMNTFTHRFDADFARATALPQPAWLSERRRASYARFQHAGLPTQREEGWKYTSLAALERVPLEESGIHIIGGLPTPFDTLTPWRVAFSSGTAVPSTVPALPEGVTLMPLAQALLEARPAAMAYFGRIAAEEALTDFNSALWRDGLYLEIAPKVVLTQPLYVQQLGCGGGTTQLRHLLVVGESSQATLIQHSLSGDAGAHFSNIVSECALGRGARLMHISIQEENAQAMHIARTAVQCAADSQYAHLAISAGGALTRNDLILHLGGPGAECLLNGLTLGRGRSHTDQHVFVDHAQPGGTSRQLYKSVLWDRARTVFNGGVRVAAGAQKTDAQQVNRNLLLSKDAEADSKPQLEIFADDVKCSHGSATGGLDAAQLFYLRSRGLGEAQARAMLVEAYAAEVLGHLDDTLHPLLTSWLHDKLEAHHAV